MIFREMGAGNCVLVSSLIFATTLTLIFPIQGIHASSCMEGSENGPCQHRNFPQNLPLSTPHECARKCREGAPPKICYYQFTVELYSTLGGACNLCSPNATNRDTCQCVLADGYEKSFMAINRQLPGPSIQVCEGDKVVVDVKNSIEGSEVTIHWHGISQRGTQYYDGVPMVTQCAISQGDTFRYQFCPNYGTHWYHAHTGFHKIEGLFGGIVVKQAPSKDRNSHLYDYDCKSHVVVISDWKHSFYTEQIPGLIHRMPGHRIDSMLINGKGQYTDPASGNTTNTPIAIFKVAPGKKHRFRLINASGFFCRAQFTIQGHDLTVIATDGRPVKPITVNSIISASGERYDFVVKADQPVGAYWIQVKALGQCEAGQIKQLAILRYASGPSWPSTHAPTYNKSLPTGVVLNPFDNVCDGPGSSAICTDQLRSAEKVDKALLSEPDVKTYLALASFNYKVEHLFNPLTYKPFITNSGPLFDVKLLSNISYVLAPAPPLSQIDDIPPETFCNANNIPEKCGTPCLCTHKIDVPLNAIVEVVIADEPSVQPVEFNHPFHLHGNTFNVIGMGKLPVTNHTYTMEKLLDLDRRGVFKRNFHLPPSKDTVQLPTNGYVIFRFKANNPGWWFFHCHYLQHIAGGMDLLFHVGTQADLPPVPKNFPKCGNFLPPIQRNW